LYISGKQIKETKMPRTTFATYRELLEALKQLGDDELDMTVTVYDCIAEEAFPVDDYCVASEVGDCNIEDMFEDTQPVLIIKR
jgi:hypothetical protein